MLNLHKHDYPSIRDIKQNSQITPSQTLLLTILDVEHCSIKALAKRLQIPLKTIENLLSGKTQDPHVTTFHKIFYFYCQIYSKQNNSSHKCCAIQSDI